MSEFKANPTLPNSHFAYQTRKPNILIKGDVSATSHYLTFAYERGQEFPTVGLLKYSNNKKILSVFW